MDAVRFARVVFTVAGVYGILVLFPGYFMEARVGIDHPPAITHAEYYYGFIGIGLAWQVVFLMIGRDPLRHRPLMLAAVLEKVGFGIPVAMLYAQAQVAGAVFAFSLVDWLLGVGFALAYWKTRTAKLFDGRIPGA